MPSIIGKCKHCGKLAVVSGNKVGSENRYDYVCLFCSRGWWAYNGKWDQLAVTITARVVLKKEKEDG